MSVTVTAALRAEVSDPATERLDLRVIAKLPVPELLDHVRAAVDQFERDWADDEPFGGDDVPPAQAFVASAAPDVLVFLDKIPDLSLTFERLVAAIEQAVPGRVRLDLAKPTRATSRPAWCLQLRIALNGHWERQAFEPDVDLDAIDEHCVAWLKALGAREPMSIRTPRERFVPVPVGAETDTLRDYRRYFQTRLVTAVGDRVRAIANWVPDGWLSLLSGTTAIDTFDWRAEWAVIDPLFRVLEPFTRTAIVTRAPSIHASAAATHTRRTLRPHAHNAALGRALEQHGLVDADGRFFVTEPPRRISPRWTQTPYGHLTQVDAPDLDAWLDRMPSEETLAAGRKELASLLREDRWSDRAGVIPPGR